MIICFRMIFLIMVKFLTLFFLLTFSHLGLSNESLSKLNNLYLNGVLDEEMYFESLNKLGIDIDNEIFQNLFDLFSNQTLDLQNYEKSLSNLVNLSNVGNSKKEDSIDNNENNSLNGVLSKKYKTIECVGDGELCKSFQGEILFTSDDGKVHWDDEFKKTIVGAEIVAVMNEKFSIFGGNQFLSIITVRHAKGFMIDFIANGSLNLNKDTFDVEKVSIRVNGKDISVLSLENV